MKDRLSIVHVSTVDLGGGAEKVAFRLADSQLLAGHKVTMLVGQKRSALDHVQAFPLDYDPALLRHCNERGLLYYEFQGSHRLVNHPAVLEADVIHLHNLHGGYFNPFSLALLSNLKPVVWTLHDMQAITGHCAHAFECAKWISGCERCPDITVYPSLPVDGTAELWKDKRLLYSHSPVSVVTPSRWLAAKVEDSILKGRPVETIRNGVDTKVFRPHDRQEMRRRFALPEDAILIAGAANTGSLSNPWKGGAYALAALDSLFARHENVYFIDIGARASSGHPRIINIPWVDGEDELARLYSTLDIFLSTSIAETFGLVTLEAMSCGVPAVAFATGGVPEVIRDGRDGFIAAYKDADSLSEKLSRLIESPALRREFAENARKRALEFDLEGVAADYEQHYRRFGEEWRSNERTFLAVDDIPEVIRTVPFLFNGLLALIEAALVEEPVEAGLEEIKRTVVSRDWEALVLCLQALPPAFCEIALWASDLLVEEGHFEKSLAILLKLQGDRPEDPRLLKRLGIVQAQLGNPQAALAALQDGLRLAPEDLDLLVSLATVFQGLGEEEKAEEHFRRALSIDPNEPDALAGLGELMQARPRDEGAYLVSAIVSTYNSEAFIRGCLEDLESQTIADRIEIIVIDSASPQNERAIVEEFQRRYDNIKYIRTRERETVYQAWNRGAKAASGKYLSNANTDDRHRPDAFEVMSDYLENHPEKALVYSNQLATDEPNKPFQEAHIVGQLTKTIYHRNIMLTGCYMGSQPMWRRAIHDELGYFDERFKSAGDYELWCRIAQEHELGFIPQPLGLYYFNSNGVELSNLSLSLRETEQIKAMYAESLKRVPDETSLEPAAFRFLLPFFSQSDRGFLAEAITAYLNAVPADAPVSLIIWARPGGAVEEIEEVVLRSCEKAGLDPDGAFADIEIMVAEELDAESRLRRLESADALLSSPGLAKELLETARLLDLPIVERPTSEALKELLDGWDPQAIDIVLLSHNRVEDLERSVDALYGRTSHPFRLIVVDDASDEDVQAYLEANRARFHRVVRNPENLSSLTQGIALTRSDPFIVSEPDILVPERKPCWLTRMVEMMKLYPEMGMLALNLDSSSDRRSGVDPGKKTRHGDEITLSNEGLVMQTIRRRFFSPPYTADWQVVDSIRRHGGFVGFVNELVARQNRQVEDGTPSVPALEKAGKSYLVTAIVSTYNSEAFIRGCLEDLEAQTIADKIEIVVIDSGSPQNERAIVEEFQQRYDNIVYLRTEQRETVYQAWNRGAKAASGKYLSNANTDDRHRPDAFEVMADYLEGHPEITLVYSKQVATDQPNRPFGDCRLIGQLSRSIYHRNIMLGACYMGSQPMWRRSIHDELGYFDESFKSAGDYEFWCRIAQAHEMAFLPEALGLYYYNPKGVEHSDLSLSYKETERIKARYAESLKRVPDESSLEPARFRFLLFSESDQSFSEEAITAYLKAVEADALVSLVVLSKQMPVEEIEKVVLRSCEKAGLDPNGSFADIEVVLLEDEASIFAHLDAADTLLASPGLSKGLLEAARFLDLPIVDRPTPEALKAIFDGWNPEAIDIVLLSHNRLKYLEQTVDALYERTDHPFRLIVVDNASDEDVLAYLEANRARFHRVVRNPENFWTPAFTQGIALTRSDPFIVSDPDILVPERKPCWLTRMVEMMKLYPEMGMLALNLDPRNKPAKLSDVYLGNKSRHGTEITLSNVGTVMQTIRRRFFVPPYTTDWEAVESVRRQSGFVGFVNELVAYHLGWDEERDYPEHLVKKFRYFNENYGSEMYRLYTQEPDLLAEMADKKMVSVVVLTLNQLTYTKKCVQSLYKHTDRSFELILVDNGSKDGTREYLRALAEEQSNVRVILNEENRGFPGGCNQGISASSGDYVLLLNNDTVVGENWLGGMLEAFSKDGVGLVGPRTNYINGSQMFSPVSYDPDTLDGFDEFARRWREEHRGQLREEKRVIGFCALISREVLDRIGGLDEGFGSGNYEDDDYCMRALLAGFRIMVAEEVFVHHFGHATFDGQKLDYTDSIEGNWRRFKNKWHLPEGRSSKDGFSPSRDILVQPFDAEVHSEPLFSSRIEAAELPDRRGFNILLADADEEMLRKACESFLTVFEEGEDVALHILAGPAIERAQEIVEEVLLELGLDPERIPDVSLLNAPETPLDLPRYIRAADAVIGSRRVVFGAQALGIKALLEVESKGLRALVERRSSLKK